MAEKTIVSMTPEQSAAWLRGEDNWLSHITDPAVKAKLKRQQQANRDAFWASIELWIEALKLDSEQTAARLTQLRDQAKHGDTESLKLIWVMITELAGQAFVDIQ